MTGPAVRRITRWHRCRRLEVSLSGFWNHEHKRHDHQELDVAGAKLADEPEDDENEEKTARGSTLLEDGPGWFALPETD